MPLPAVLWPFAAATACALTALALVWAGPVVALVPVALLAAVVVLSRPAALLAGFLVLVVLLETDEKGFLPGRGVFYSGVPSLADLAFAMIVLAVVAEVVRRRRTPALPGPFTLPLVLLAIAVLAGLANGWFAGAAPEEALPPLQALVPLIVLPFVVVNIGWDTTRDRVIIGAVAAIAIVKGLEGMLSWVLDAGRPVGDSTLTFYSPAPNFLLLLFLLGALAAALGHVRMPLWVLAGIPFCAAAFVLSYRRNFWIAAILGVLMVLLLGSRLRSGRVLLLGLAVFAIAVRATFGVTGAPELEGAVGERLQSLSPERVRVDPYDRYRLDEAANVVGELRAQPVFGLGLGVPWTARHPLPAELEGGRQYTHVVVLWYWLKLGALGAIAYVALMLTAALTAVRIARFHRDALVRAAGLAVAAGVVALVAAETTGSFTGVGSRSSILFGALAGWLALGARSLRREPE